MIPTLTPEEKADWDRKMEKHHRRCQKAVRWHLVKQLTLPVVLILGFFAACGTCHETPKPAFSPDGAYLDSMLHDRSWISGGNPDSPVMENKWPHRDSTAVIRGLDPNKTYTIRFTGHLDTVNSYHWHQLPGSSVLKLVKP